ncbi:glycosyltransferase family 2 protein [Ligilactobacillus salivarius]|uniref:glycosyltransferase family 2 protein n=1 Tax=Ligilactobacillus salivarius TaxID=1624 RepID=UPI003F24DDD0
MVKVSIGVPVYNVDQWLRQCLDSIRQQSFQDFEVIMVDDGSTDNSFEICQEYAFKDKRFKLYHQENKGLAGARNTCLKHMNGEYVTWVDSDDWIEVNYLKNLVMEQIRTQADIVSMGFKMFGNGKYYIVGEDISKKYGELQDNIIPKERALADMFNNGEYFLLHMWGNLIDVNLYRGFVCSEDVMYEDTGNKFKLFLQSKKNVGLSKLDYVYRIRENSIVGQANDTKSFNKMIKGRMSVISNIEKLIYYLDISKVEVDEIGEGANKSLTEFLDYSDDWTEIEKNENRNYILRRKKLINDVINN